MRSENTGESGFVDPSDFVEPHSLPLQNTAAYLPACSPVVNRDEMILGHWDPAQSRRRRTTSHTSNKGHSLSDLPDGVFACEPESGDVSDEMFHDSGVYFGQSTPGGIPIGNRIPARRRAYTGDSWPEMSRESDLAWRQSSSRLNGSRTGLYVRVSVLLMHKKHSIWNKITVCRCSFVRCPLTIRLCGVFVS